MSGGLGVVEEVGEVVVVVGGRGGCWWVLTRGSPCPSPQVWLESMRAQSSCANLFGCRVRTGTVSLSGAASSRAWWAARWASCVTLGVALGARVCGRKLARQLRHVRILRLTGLRTDDRTMHLPLRKLA